MFRFVFIIIVSPALVTASLAADISFSAGVDRTRIGLDEQLTLELRVTGDAQNLPQPSTPAIPGFQIYGAGTSQQISFVNGVVQSSVTHRYMLVPREVGEFTIASQEISLDGRTYTTDPIKIIVTQATGSQRGTARQNDEPSKSSQQPIRREVGDFFIEALVDKDTAYVNEQVTLTFRFYQGRPLHTTPDYRPPGTTGFWVEDLPPQRNFTKTVNGRTYTVAEIKTALFPTSPGEKVIGKASVNIKRDDLFSIFDRDPFGFFDRRRQSGEPVYLETEPIRVVIVPLPVEGKPADFSGSVGDFKMTTSIDKTEVEVNQPVTVKTRISGKGNIKTLPEPQVPEMDDFRVFSSGKSEEVSKAGYVVGGSKVFELTFVPRRPGIFEIPAITSNYFDPEDGRYKKLAGKSYTVSVAGVSNEEIAAQAGFPSGRLDLVARDIRYIVTDVSGTDSQSGLYLRSPAFVIGNLISLAALVVVFAVRRRRDRLAGDVGYRRLKRAVKMARMRLSRAEVHLRSGESDKFYTEISRALNEYTGDKFNVSAQGLTTQQAMKMFAEQNTPEDLREQYAEIISTCDEGRFTSSTHDDSTMQKVLRMSEEWIVRIEGRLK